MKNRIFRHKIAIVVGASGGIGSALVKILKKQGIKVFTVSTSSSEFKLDISVPEQIEKLAKEIKKRFNKIDFLFNASGIAYYKGLIETSFDDIDEVIRINLIGAMELTQKFIPLMNNKGSVIHLGSMAGIYKGHKYFSIYSASKEGLAGFLRSVSVEFPKLNFILVTPAGVNTNIAKKSIGLTRLAKKFITSELDTVEDIAKGVLKNINYRGDDIRVFPTKLSRDTYEKFRK